MVESQKGRIVGDGGREGRREGRRGLVIVQHPSYLSHEGLSLGIYTLRGNGKTAKSQLWARLNLEED